MARINTPVDHMFRAGQISSKEWARLSMTANGKGGKMKSRMANFNAKGKDEGVAHQNRAVAGTRKGHIDGPDQGKAAKGAFSAPTRGGGVQSSAGGKTTSNEINERQKPNFPRQGAGHARKTLPNQQPSSSNAVKGENSVNSYYGGAIGRANRPARLKPVMTGGSKF